MKKKIFDFIKKYGESGKGIRTVITWAIIIYFGYVFWDIDQGKMLQNELDQKIDWIDSFKPFWYTLVGSTLIGGTSKKYLDYKKGNGQP